MAIVSEWLLVGVGVLIHFTARGTLPPALRAYLTQQDDAPFSTLDTIYFIVGTPVFVLGFIASVGLWFLRRWARLAYAITTVMLCLLVLCDPPSVRTALEAFIEELSLLVSGFIVALTFYAPLQFQSRNA